jgi:hypothetical protein
MISSAWLPKGVAAAGKRDRFAAGNDGAGVEHTHALHAAQYNPLEPRNGSGIVRQTGEPGGYIRFCGDSHSVCVCDAGGLGIC